LVICDFQIFGQDLAMQEAPHLRREKTRNDLGQSRHVTGQQHQFTEVVSLDITVDDKNEVLAYTGQGEQDGDNLAPGMGRASGGAATGPQQ
jgi:hypothetical protein